MSDLRVFKLMFSNAEDNSEGSTTEEHVDLPSVIADFVKKAELGHTRWSPDNLVAVVEINPKRRLNVLVNQMVEDVGAEDAPIYR